MAYTLQIGKLELKEVVKDFASRKEAMNSLLMLIVHQFMWGCFRFEEMGKPLTFSLRCMHVLSEV